MFINITEKRKQKSYSNTNLYHSVLSISLIGVMANVSKGKQKGINQNLNEIRNLIQRSSNLT